MRSPGASQVTHLRDHFRAVRRSEGWGFISGLNYVLIEMKRDVYSIAHAAEAQGTHQYELMRIKRLKLDSDVQLDFNVWCRRNKPWFLSALLPHMLGCVGYGEFHLGPRSPHGDFFALTRVNLASSPRKEFIGFSALFIRDNAGGFW